MPHDSALCWSVIAVLWGVGEVYITCFYNCSSRPGLCHNRISVTVYPVMVCPATTAESCDVGAYINPTTGQVYFKCQLSASEFVRRCLEECSTRQYCWSSSPHCSQGDCRRNSQQLMREVMVRSVEPQITVAKKSTKVQTLGAVSLHATTISMLQQPAQMMKALLV